jgi:NitT/TauT family transport system substrate-binding protein
MPHTHGLTRRTLLGSAVAAGVSACAPIATAPTATAVPASLPPPETATLRLPVNYSPCDPYFWLADDLLREEGFTDVQRAKPGSTLIEGTVDVSVLYANAAVAFIDAGQPVVVVGGGHPGCLEMWARTGINGLRDLRGKRVVVESRTATDILYTFWVSLLTSVGVDPSEVNWIEDPNYTNAYFIDGKVDAIIVSGTGGSFLRANPANPGRVILDQGADKPWSQYYCCLIVANRDWAQRNPVATKRLTRAIERAADLVAKDVAFAARAAIDRKLFPPVITYEILFDFLKMMSFSWREYDPEETLRFYSLRLADGKLIKKTPQQIITDGADLAYFKQLRKELKT